MLSRLAALLFALALFPSCDAVGDEEKDFEGSWSIVEVEVDDADITREVQARFEELVISFNADTEGDRFTIFGDIEGTSDDLTISGTYNATEDVLRLTAPVFPEPLDADYDFVTDDEIELETGRSDADLWGLIFVGIDLRTADEVRVTLSR